LSFLLDTNVLAEVRKPRPHPAVMAWFEPVPGSELYLSVLVLGEIQQGVARCGVEMPGRQPSTTPGSEGCGKNSATASCR